MPMSSAARHRSAVLKAYRDFVDVARRSVPVGEREGKLEEVRVAIRANFGVASESEQQTLLRTLVAKVAFLRIVTPKTGRGRHKRESGVFVVRDGAVVEGFEFLGELAGDADPGPGGEFSEDFEGGGNPVRGFEEESGFGGVEGGLELLAPFAFFHREEAVEGKRMRGEAGGDEGRSDGRWSGKDGEGDSGIACRF